MTRHEPNRALARGRLEMLAWQKTPKDYRGGSGISRSVRVLGASGATTSKSLSSMTDNELRKYIGPEALTEAGDMAKNGRGIYHGTPIANGDYAISWSGGVYNRASKRWHADRVGAGGTHTRIGLASGYQDQEAVIEATRKDMHTRGSRGTKTLFVHTGVDDEPWAVLGQVSARGAELYAPNSRGLRRAQTMPAVREPKFQLGDRVRRYDNQFETGTIGFIGQDQGEEYGGWQYKVDWEAGGNGGNASPRHYVPENKLRLVSSNEAPTRLSPNARREAADEHAARELSLFIENDYSLVGAPNSQGKAIEKSLLAKIKNGSFDLAKSELAWMYLIESGAKKYANEFADGKDWSKIFSPATRELVAHEFATTFAEENGFRPNSSVEDSVEDGDYVVQVMYSDSSVTFEAGFDDEDQAIREAKKLLGSSWVEGDLVRVITRDSELVFEQARRRE